MHVIYIVCIPLYMCSQSPKHIFNVQVARIRRLFVTCIINNTLK